MNYYKIRRESKVVGVCTDLEFRRWQAKHSVIVVSDANRVEAVQVGENFYRDSWMAADSGHIDYVEAEVVEIGAEEYETLAEQLKTEEELDEVIEIEPDEEAETDDEEPEPVQKTVKQILAEQQAKIDELSQQLIAAGKYGGV